MRRSRLLAVIGLLLLAGIVGLNGLRWRAELLALKAAGKIPDLAWGDLIRYLPPRRPITLRSLNSTRNPYLSIHPSDTSAEAVAAGSEVYRRLCVSCHGMDGSGPTGPARLNAALPHGSSDWALYRAISRGVPGTGMPSFSLRAREYWQLVTYVRNLRREPPARPETPPTPLLTQLVPVSQEALVEARRDSANWLTYSGAYDGRRYSNLSQINRDNVPRLQLLWMHQIGGSERFETTPLVRDGVLFLTTPDYGVRALDAESGTLLWTYQRELRSGTAFCCGKVNRGLAMLGSTLYLATLDARLLALDARTGKRLWDVAAADPAAGYSFTSAPLAARGLVLIGSAGGEYASRGFIDAYDAETGARRWRFYTIPAPGEPGSETWGGDSWKTGGGAPWLTGSYDPALDLVYWGIGNPNPDFDGDSRPGDNLYTNSVVALERTTGKLRWHFQFTPHDEHDWDSAQIPVLADPPGSPPLLLWANRNGFYYVLNRATGGFLQGRAFARQTWAAGLDSNGRPIVRPESAPTVQGTAVYPGVEGATNWWSPSYSPRTGSFYVPTFDRLDLVFKGIADESGGLRLGGARRAVRPGEGLGAIHALDALSGARRWEFETFTTTEEFLTHVGGLLSTASDLLFGAREDQLLALDATNGRLLWTFKAGGGVHAAPITYLVGGRQRLTVAAGQALLTFGLP
jgi:alcohol dehydrogenase (cytochrome c)